MRRKQKVDSNEERRNIARMFIFIQRNKKRIPEERLQIHRGN